MAYNNGFPIGYQQMYYPQYQSSTQTNNGIIWVQGEAGAKSYLVAPNTTVQLWDSENQVIYLKSADASGMPSMKTLDYTVRGLPAASEASGGIDIGYATKSDLEALRGELEAVKREIEGKRKKKEVQDDG